MQDCIQILVSMLVAFAQLSVHLYPQFHIRNQMKLSEIPSVIIPTRTDSVTLQLAYYPTSFSFLFSLFLLVADNPYRSSFNQTGGLIADTYCPLPPQKSHLANLKRPDVNEQMIIKLDLVLRGPSCLDRLANFHPAHTYYLDKTHMDEE